MKKRLVILSVIVFLSIFSILVLILTGSNQKTVEEEFLILKEIQGKVVLKKGEKIIKTYEQIVVSVLPKDDQNLLKEGIIIENEEHLMSIIEDYDG